MKTVLALAAMAVGLLLVAIAGLWFYVSATATPLHPDPNAVRSVMHSTPLPRWADAVGRGAGRSRARA